MIWLSAIATFLLGVIAGVMFVGFIFNDFGSEEDDD